MPVESWKSFFEIGGVVLLFLTFAFGAGFMLTGKVVSEHQEKQLRQFDRDLTDAKSALATQQTRAADADARVAGLEQDAANAKTEMAKQQTRAATAERSLLELQQKIKWRTITAEQKKQFIGLTKDVSKGPLDVTSMDGDPESAAFAKQLADMFSAAGWDPTLNSLLPIGATPMGLGLSIRSKLPVKLGDPLFHAAALQRALETIGFPSGTNENTNLPIGKVVLMVGHKP